MSIRSLAPLFICTLATGCQLADNAIHNLSYEAKLKSNEVLERCRYEKLANSAWETVGAHACGQGYSDDYVKGFKDGFIDYLQFGGSGQPPFVPPKHYWGAHYRTPDGYRAVQDWYAGFRHGVAVAHESGYRQFGTVPSAAAVEVHEEHPVHAPHPAPAYEPPVEEHWPAAPQPAPPQRLPPAPPPMPAAPKTSSFDLEVSIEGNGPAPLRPLIGRLATPEAGPVLAAPIIDEPQLPRPTFGIPGSPLRAVPN